MTRLNFSEANHPDLGWGFEVPNQKIGNFTQSKLSRFGGVSNA